MSPERDEQCPRDEASVQRATKELNLGTQPGREREGEREGERQAERQRERERGADREGQIFGCVNSLSGMKS